MIFLGTTLFALAAFLLFLLAAFGIQRQQLSSAAFAVLAGYAMLLAFGSASLASRFGEWCYFEAAVIYFVGTVFLSLSSIVFASVLGVGRYKMPRWRTDEMRRHAGFALVLGGMSLVFQLMDRSSLLDAWSEVRSESGPMTVMAAFSLLLGFPGIVSAVIARRHLVAISLLFVSIFSFVLLGSRAAVMCALALALWLLVGRVEGAGKKLGIVAFAAVVGLALHVVLRSLRGLGAGGVLSAIGEGNLVAVLFEIDNDIDFSGGESDIPKYFLYSTVNSSADEFGFMTSVQRIISIPVPRIEGWFDKPTDVTYLFWAKAFREGLFSEYQGQEILLDSYLNGSFGSLHPTLFGEYYLTGGWASLIPSLVVVGGVFALIDLSMRRVNRLTSLALCGPVLIGFFFVARGNSVIGLGYFFYLGVFFTSLRISMRLIVRGIMEWKRLVWRGRAVDSKVQA